MSTQTTQQHFQEIAQAYWDYFAFDFPDILDYKCPTIKINNRFTKTGGLCHNEDNLIELAGKMIIKHYDQMAHIVLPHELAHQIEYIVFGAYPRKAHHGKDWIYTMERIGLVPDPYHELEV